MAAPAIAGVHFSDGFDDPTLDPAKWDRSFHATLARTAPPRPGFALLLEAGTDSESSGELCSAAIDLSGVDRAELSFTVLSAADNTPAAVTVDYFNEQGSWMRADRVSSRRQRSATTPLQTSLALPHDALHRNFRMRFRVAGAGSCLLDDVRLESDQTLCTVTLAARPDGHVPIEIFVGDRAITIERIPTIWTVPAGVPAHLVAPATRDGWVFSHWTVDGRRERRGARVLFIEPTSDLSAVAHYRPDDGSGAASVELLSTPERGVRVRIGAEPDDFFATLTCNTAVQWLVGESVVLEAEPVHEGLAFSTWTVNGCDATAGDRVLEHQVRGVDVLVAEYVVRGDMNGDDRLDKFDVDVFVLALVDPAQYRSLYPDLDRTLRGDTNGDGAMDEVDMESFIDLLLSQ